MATGQTGPQECAGCGKKIHDKFILKVGGGGSGEGVGVMRV